MSIPRQLLTYINSGKCFAIVGSGLSTAMGYPSWQKLASDAASMLPATDNEQATLRMLLEKRDYPEVFQRVAKRLGDMPQLLGGLCTKFVRRDTVGEAYQHICRWPFRCYLTTNFDDELASHLSATGVHFTTLRNSQAEMAEITSESSRRVVKLHGDFATPDDIVLGTSHYSDFETGGGRQYFRSKLTSIFQMVPVIVIGHSMSDRDLQLVLRLAKESASVKQPIFMLLADADDAEIDKLHREYNVRIISYPNSDGTHRGLIHLLRQLNRFVVPRTCGTRPPVDFPDAEEAETAVSLYVHSSLGFGANAQLLQRTLRPQVLSFAARSAHGVDLHELAGLLKPPAIAGLQQFDKELSSAITALSAEGLLTYTQDRVFASSKGTEVARATLMKRRFEEDQFFGALKTRLESHGSREDIETLIEGFKHALVNVFRKRGLSSAELLFRESALEHADMPELFDAVFPPAAGVEDFGLRAEYCEAVMDILTQPNEDQKSYLAHLAQGFFAYHMFGLDPSGQEVRRRVFQGTVWILDSYILIPLVAQHSVQSAFMIELGNRLTALGIRPVVTPKLVSEVDRAFGWMRSQLKGARDGDERNHLLRTTQRPQYSENPFIDAFIQGKVIGSWRSMSEFVEALGYQDGVGFRSVIEKSGIEVIDHGFSDDNAVQLGIEKLSSEIYSERGRQGTIRGVGDVQAKAEAEVMHLIRSIRQNGFRGDASIKKAFFVSASRVLDSLYSKTDGLVTWFPESLFKHLCYLSGEVGDAEAIFRSITTSYYSVGISVVDEAAYRQFFKPAISEATATLKQEVENYTRAVASSVDEEHRERDSILDAYNSLPDLEKPHFVEQLGWATARRNEARWHSAEKARREAELMRRNEVKSLREEYERKAKERQRHDEGREKNLRDPKHVRKLHRQAKDRKRRKRR
jgi:hypothetical protein